jgi:hypothetical protein
MSQTIVRFYATQAQATRAAEELRSQGYAEVYQFNGAASKKASEGLEQSLVDAMTKASMWKSYAEIYAARLANGGGAMVMVHALFGSALNATEVLDSHQPVDNGIEEDDSKDELPAWDEAAPFSSVLGIPVLMETKLPAEMVSGVPSLSRSPSPFSNFFGLPVLKRGKQHATSSMGLPLLSNKATPLSSAIGMRTLSRNPTPLSSMFGLPVLKKS